MSRNLTVSVRLLLAFTLLTGVAYPLAVTALAQTLFPEKAAGSLIRTIEGRVVGSELIGQPFERPDRFWGRLSATSRVPYDASASSGSNFGPLNPALRAAVESRIAATKSHPAGSGRIPVDLVTSSASGLDPHISPASAEWQVPRVAAVSRISEDRLRQLIAESTTGRSFGILGEPRVNVLRLNLALEREKGSPASIEP